MVMLSLPFSRANHLGSLMLAAGAAAAISPRPAIHHSGVTFPPVSSAETTWPVLKGL